MDSSDFNKYAGAILGAFLVFLLLNFFSAKIYGTSESGHHGHDELAFAVEIEEAGAAVEEEVAVVDYGALLASVDLSAGEKVFGKCKACHKVEDGKNGVGPHLWGVVGRDIAAVDGYGYSDALGGMDGAWDFAALSGFLENPKGWAPGTKMAYAGLSDPEDRVNLIAWLNEADGSPVALEAPGAADGAAVETEETTEVAVVTEEAAESAATATTEAVETATTEATETVAATTSEVTETTEAAAVEATGTVEEAVTEATETVTAAASEATETVEASASEAAETAEAAATEATETVAAVASEATETTAAAASEATETAESATEEVQVAAVAAFPAGDAEAGAKVFRKCRACHKVEDGKNGVGPHLWGVVGREIASVDGFKYSSALQDLPGVWTATELSAFLEKPKDYAPGTKMAYAGLRKEEDRINIITYLNEVDGTPEPLQ